MSVVSAMLRTASTRDTMASRMREVASLLTVPTFTRVVMCRSTCCRPITPLAMTPSMPSIRAPTARPMRAPMVDRFSAVVMSWRPAAQTGL